MIDMDDIELTLCESYGDYTLKVFNRYRIDSKFYAEVLDESGDFPEMVRRTRLRNLREMAVRDGRDVIRELCGGRLPDAD